jgi:hypothetical protein
VYYTPVDNEEKEFSIHFKKIDSGKSMSDSDELVIREAYLKELLVDTLVKLTHQIATLEAFAYLNKVPIAKAKESKAIKKEKQQINNIMKNPNLILEIIPYKE